MSFVNRTIDDQNGDEVTGEQVSSYYERAHLQAEFNKTLRSVTLQRSYGHREMDAVAAPPSQMLVRLYNVCPPS